MKTIQILIAASLLMLVSMNKLAAQMSGQQIMEAVYNNPGGDDVQGQLEMRLTNKQGDQRVRQLQQFIKDEGDTEKTIMFFLSPADVKNTSFMSWSYADGRDDDQWIYLPALKRVKRISSDSKSDAFMGSDFTYDDLGDRHPNEDNHQLLKEETVGSTPCYVVESTPKDEDYMYSKTVTWVAKDSFIGLKRDFYDEDGKLLKSLHIKKYEQISGFWMILETEMHNVQKDHRTTMKFTNVQINQGIPASKFTERSMTLGR
jgi:outer membrane lipoprotein-sorting protein